MDKKVSIEQLLEQIKEILTALENIPNTEPKELPPEVMVQLDIMESAVPIIKAHWESMYKEANIDMDAITNNLAESPDTEPRTKRIIEKAKEIERDAKLLQLANSAAIKRAKGKRKKKQSQQMKERRKLFKPLGGDDTWIPL